MLEWLKRHAWKACSRLKRLTGSNPVLSAKEIQRKSQARLNFFSVSLLHRPAAGGAGCASSASKSLGKNGIAGRRNGIAPARSDCAKDSGLPIHIGRPPCNSNLKLNL